MVSALSLLLVGVGLFSIANVMLASVLERTAEIGLRRALGASRSDVAIILLTESAVIGLIGGMIGAVLSGVGSVGVAVAREWPIELQLWRFAIAPVVGAVVGSLAGAYPAARASRLDPVTALQR